MPLFANRLDVALSRRLSNLLTCLLFERCSLRSCHVGERYLLVLIVWAVHAMLATPSQRSIT